MSDNQARYPRHQLFNKEKPTERLCAAPLVLLEQVGRKTSGTDLWCIGCEAVAHCTPGEHEAAKRAASAEGFEVHERTAPLTPGDLDASERACLYWLRAAEDEPGSRDAYAAKAKDTKAGAGLIGRGLTAGAGLVLTDAGRAMANLIASPVVDVARLKFDPAHAPRPPRAKRAKAPKARQVEPEADPLACECGHGVTTHRSTGDGPCKSDGCACERWHKPPKKRAKKAKAA